MVMSWSVDSNSVSIVIITEYVFFVPLTSVRATVVLLFDPKKLFFEQLRFGMFFRSRYLCHIEIIHLL